MNKNTNSSALFPEGLSPSPSLKVTPQGHVPGSTQFSNTACLLSSTDDQGDDEPSLQGSIIERSTSFDAMLKYLESGHENFKENSHKFLSSDLGQTFEDTWDYSLRPQTNSPSKQKSTIWLSDTAFLRKLEEFNGFATCEHEVVKIPCPCENKTPFNICAKCHRVFCCNRCYKIAKGYTKITSKSEATVANANSLSSPSPQSIKQENTVKFERNKPNSQKMCFPKPNDLGVAASFQQQPPQNYNQMQMRPPPHSYNNNPYFPFPHDPHFINAHHQMPNQSFPWNLGDGLLPGQLFYPPPKTNQRPPPAQIPTGINFNQLRGPIVNSSSFHSPNSKSNRNLQQIAGQIVNVLESKPTPTSSLPPNKSQQPRPLNPQSSLHFQPKENKEIRQKESIASQIERSFKPTNTHVPSCNQTQTSSQETIQVQKFRGLGRGYQSPKTPSSIISTVPSQNKAIKNEDKSEKFLDSTPEDNENTQSSSSTLKDIQERAPNLVKEGNKTAIGLGAKPKKVKASKSPSNPKKSELEKVSKIEINGEALILFGIPMLVGYSFGESLFDFFVWSGLGSKNNDEIAHFLNEKGANLPPLKAPVVGDYCVAKYNNSEVDGWYRGQISQVSQNTARVYFIDYGNDEDLPRDELKIIPTELLQIKPSAIRICIGDFASAVELQELEPAFNNFIVDQWIRVTIIDNKLPHPSGEIGVLRKYHAKVEIKYGERWIGMADILQSDGFGTKFTLGNGTAIKNNINFVDEYPALKINHEIPVELTHVNSLNDFYVIPKSRLAEFDFLMKRLQGSNPSNFKHFRIDKWADTNFICLAQRPNGQWARIMIAEITPNFTAEVHFIDFGDTREVQLDQLKRIPLDYLKIPKFAYRCSLPVFPSKGVWDPQDQDFKILVNLMESKLPIVIVVFAMEDELHCQIVEVFLQEKLSGLTKSLMMNKPESCSLEYTIDLDIREQLKQSSSTLADNPSSEPPPAASNQTKPQISPKENVEIVQDFVVKNEPISSGNTKLPPPQPSLHHYIKEDFQITHFVSYNSLFIRPQLPDEEMFLMDEIVECIDSEKVFEVPPALNTLLVAQISKNNWQRAVVRKICRNKIKVQLIDLGDTLKLPLKDVIPASEMLLEKPALAYKVKLINVEEDPGLLMSSDFLDIKKALLKLKFNLTQCSGPNEPYLVDLKSKDAPSNDTISNRILDKQIWEWEQILNKYDVENDVKLFKRSKYYETDDPKEESLSTGILPPGQRMEGAVSKFTRNGDIHLINIKQGYIQRDMKVLENQINRFVQKVKAVDFFPKFEEVVLVYLADIPELRDLNLYGVGKWNRCVREEEYYRNVDFDEIYPLTFGLSGHLITRKIGPEFIRFRTGVFMAKLKDYKESEAFFKVMERELKPRTPIYFTVDHYDVQNCIHIITIENLERK